MSTAEVDRGAPPPARTFDTQHDSLDRLERARASADPGRIGRAEQRVVSAHLGAADAVARRFWGRGIPLEDLEQVARLGLVTATKRWDPAKGPDFLGFAVPTMSGSVKRHFRDHLKLVRVPRRLQEINAASRQAEVDLWQVGVSPGAREIAALLRVPQTELEQAHLARTAVGSLDLASQLPVPAADHVAEDHLDLVRAVQSLTQQERDILGLYYFQECTQQTIADRYRVSQMQVSRMLKAIHRKLGARLAVA